jgi:hypothetical protein
MDERGDDADAAAEGGDVTRAARLGGSGLGTGGWWRVCGCRL